MYCKDPKPVTRASVHSAILRPLLAATLMLALVSCASTPEPPTRALQAAEQAISTAEQAGVADYASLELNQARQKLEAAQVAVRDESMVVAQRLADESRVSAELATAKAEVAKAKEVNDELQRSLDTLRQELQRTGGTQR